MYLYLRDASLEMLRERVRRKPVERNGERVPLRVFNGLRLLLLDFDSERGTFFAYL